MFGEEKMPAKNYDYIIDCIEEITIYNSATNEKLASLGVKEDAAQLTYINCHNCGAPVRGCECEYCGTRY